MSKTHNLLVRLPKKENIVKNGTLLNENLNDIVCVSFGFVFFVFNVMNDIKENNLK